ncbi:protein kinase [Nostoc sp. UHCC 0302]|uniref:serine/threonine protein kinase n=1 Tax=Nostoc sp. UHCC 0302 TaxID=3134896 RepID=UPI00311CB5E7
MKTPPSSNSWNGRFVGDNQRYRLDQKLGGGGMGEVFLAMDTRVGQQVALKLLKDTLVASQEMRKRFEREIAVCAALQSDHIVKISDCGVTPEGFPFYVMEYLRGQTLRQLLLREKRLSVERTVKIMAQVCKGLQLAHQGVTLQRDGGKSTEHIKVVHRDLKPDNIFLVPTDLGEWVKILDFGVAKIRSESTENTNITNITSTFIGTFRYAPPEQIQSDLNLNSRGDIYSLGIILYEMLSAADPFGISIKGNQVSEASWVLAHAYEPPKPLRSQPGCENLSVEVEAVVMKCLQKNPDNRFATVEALNQALQAAAKSVTGTISTSGQANVHPQPLYNQGSNYETVTRSSSDDTILRPQPSYNQDSNHETVTRSSSDDTILRPQPSYNQGSNHETIPRPLNPTTPSQPEETLIVPPPQYNQGSNHETTPRPLNPTTPSQPAGINPQQPPVNNPQAAKPDATLFQPRHPSNPSGQQVPPDGTLYQPRQASNANSQPGPPDATLYQPRQASNANSQPGPPDATLYQPRHPSNTNSQPGLPDATLYQPRHTSNTNSQPGLPDATLYQPRHGSNSTKPQVSPDATIFQPRQDKQPNNETNSHLWRTIGVVCASVLALALAFYLYNRLANSNNLENGIESPKTNITR